MTILVVAISLFVLAVAYGVLLASYHARWGDTPKAGHYVSKLSPTQLLSLRPEQLIETDYNVVIIDVSRWEGAMDFVKAWAAGAFGVIIKCGQGLALDPMFKVYWSLAKFAGLKRSTYWYYDSRVDPDVQAKLWADAIKDDPGEMPHFADYEETYGGKYAGIAMFVQFLLEFQTLSDLPDDHLGIYTGYYYWIENGANDPLFADYWLWLAWYSTAEVVKIPQPWTQDNLLLWQFTSSGDGPKYGASSAEIDLSYFVKGKEVFGQMFGNVTEVPTGDSMSQWFKINTPSGLNIRKDAGGVKTGALPYGYIVEGLEKHNGWVRIGRVFLNGVDVTAAALAFPNDPNNAWMSDSYLVEVPAPITDPVPTEPPPAEVKHTIDVFPDGSIRIDNGNTIP